jgi:hypothetical protein
VFKLNSEKVLIPYSNQKNSQAPSSQYSQKIPGKQQSSVKSDTLQYSDKETGQICST